MVIPRAFSSGALSIESKDRNWIFGLCFCNTLVMAAVSVVLPWSMWPIVPTFTCGLLRSNFSFAISLLRLSLFRVGRALLPAKPVRTSQTYVSRREFLTSVIPVKLLKLGPNSRLHLFNLRQIKLAHLRLIRRRQLLVQLTSRLVTLSQFIIQLLQNATGQHQIKIPNAHAFLLQPAQKLLNPVGCENPHERRFQFSEFFFFRDLDSSLLEAHGNAPCKTEEPWSR